MQCIMPSPPFQRTVVSNEVTLKSVPIVYNAKLIHSAPEATSHQEHMESCGHFGINTSQT
jgi:hypothetical protein